MFEMNFMDEVNLDNEVIEAIMDKALVCRIALCDGDKPYIVPMNFAYVKGELFLHTSVNSRKLEIIRENNSIGFEIDIGVELVPNHEKPCETTMKYQSIVGYGKAYIISDEEEKKEALNHLTSKYLGKSYNYSKLDLMKVSIVKVEIEKMYIKIAD